MKVTQDGTESRQTTITIEVEPDELEQYLNRAYRKMVGRLSIPGFRRGKAPRRIVEQFVGRETLLSEAMDDLVPEVTSKAVEQESLEMGGLPHVEIVQHDPVVLRATVPLTPVVELGDYRSLRLEEEPAEVTDEQVQEVLEGLRQELAPWQPVDRSVQFGDLVTLDLKATAQGETVSEQQDISFIPREGNDNPIPGFAEEVVGISKGETKEFVLPFPEDAADPKLAGQDVHFSVTVKEVKEKQLPELDDEFAKGIGQGYDSLESLKQQVRDSLKRDAEAGARRRFRDAVVEAVVQQARVEIPPLMVEHQVDHMLEDQERELQRRGGDIDAYLERLGKTPEELREELRPRAEQQLKETLVVNKVAEVEGITVSPEEVDAEIESLSDQAGSRGDAVRDLLNQEEGRQSLTRILRTRRTIERLVQIAKGEAEPAAPAEAEAPPAEAAEQEPAPTEEDTNDDATS